MNMEDPEIEKWKPGVHKAALLLMAGAVWIGVGLMLDILAYSWLRNEMVHKAIISAVTGFVIALLIHHVGFLRVVDRNLDRILPMEGMRCVFSFISWKSYLLIAVMILMGYFLRHSPLPKLYLAALYSAIGTALILSSFRYLRYLRKVTKHPGD
jgi:di/tricarboxylate transporter